MSQKVEKTISIRYMVTLLILNRGRNEKEQERTSRSKEGEKQRKEAAVLIQDEVMSTINCYETG